MLDLDNPAIRRQSSGRRATCASPTLETVLQIYELRRLRMTDGDVRRKLRD